MVRDIHTRATAIDKAVTAEVAAAGADSPVHFHFVEHSFGCEVVLSANTEAMKLNPSVSILSCSLLQAAVPAKDVSENGRYAADVSGVPSVCATYCEGDVSL